MSRTRKDNPNSSRNYFTQETEEWVIKYNASTSPEERNKIFREKLYMPFYKLAENIINTYKFYHTDVDTIEDLKLDVITMIFEDKIHRFDPSYGAKAYSYFGTIIKRWLIGYDNANYNRKKKHVQIDGYVDSFVSSSPEIETAPVLTLSGFFDNWIADCYENIEEMFPKEQDRNIADAILTVFKSRQNLGILKKKALYVYVREITGCETPYLTKVISTLKDSFYKRYREFKEEGLISTESSE